MRRDKLVARLAKLLALESSPNPHEAASARLQAERFMRRHGLRREDAVPAEYGFRVLVLPGSAWSSPWRFVLTTAAARHYGAQALRRGGVVRIAGEHADVEEAAGLARRLLRVVRELEAVAVWEVEGCSGATAEMLDEALPRRRRDSAFRTGAACGLARVLTRYCPGEDVVPGVSPPPEGGPPATRVLARTEGSGRDHAARVAARYRPEEVEVPSVDAAWEAFGQYVAERYAVAGPGGTVTVRRTR